MADEKKKDKKDAPPPIHPIIQDLPFIVVGLLLLLLIVPVVQGALGTGKSFESYMISITGGSSSWYPLLENIGAYIVNLYVRIAIIVCVFLVLAILYAVIRYNMVVNEVEKKRGTAKPVVAKGEKNEGADKWLRVIAHVNSQNAAEWRLAILEADVMLDEALDSRGYFGETVAEKLKAIQKADVPSLEQAWEGHKIRNAIAHQGADFLVNQREAKRVVGLFEQVLKEFSYI